MNYGELPKDLGIVELSPKEMMFYQYLPVKLIGQSALTVEPRLLVYNSLLGRTCCDFIGEFGLDKYINSYVYLTAKRLFVSPGANMNREGWHSDGFMTDDINYIWSDCLGTIFSASHFNLSQDDIRSMSEMEEQAKPEYNVVYPDKSLLRLNQYNIHKCAEIPYPILRTFVKISLSTDKYDLEGNSHNYSLAYDWEMRKRKQERNIPQCITSTM
jgi:hypothetical protein